MDNNLNTHLLFEGSNLLKFGSSAKNIWYRCVGKNFILKIIRIKKFSNKEEFWVRREIFFRGKKYLHSNYTKNTHKVCFIRLLARIKTVKKLAT